MLLALAAFYLAWQVWLSVAAPGKIAAFPTGGERVNILVTLPFPPERFHVQQFQTTDGSLEHKTIPSKFGG